MTARRTLHLLRHAKSSWDDPALADHDRPLGPRGRRAAAAMRTHLAGLDFHVDLVLVSSALRARQTWEGVAPAVVAGAVRIDPRIYEATAHELLELVATIEDEHRSVLLVGHNPGFGELAVTLASTGDGALLDALHAKYPTGALASIDLDCSWSEVGRCVGRLASFVRPRDIER